MTTCWHYLYVIVYPALEHKFYYGSRITPAHPDDDIGYFGSSVTFSHYNDVTHPEYQADALKIVLYAVYRPRNKKHTRALNRLEQRLIKTALLNTKHLGPAACLNRNVGGQIYAPAEVRREWSARGGSKSRDAGSGFHAFSAKRLAELRAKGAATTAARRAKKYVLLSPNNVVVTVVNLRAFCRVNNLDRAALRGVLSGKRKSHKNWRKPQ